jgi:peroxiredoxin
MGKQTGNAVGDQAPGFRLPSSQGGEVSLSDFRGRQHALLVFYIKDDTPG